MRIRKFVPEELDEEPHDVRFKDLYPWDAIEKTPFGASQAVIAPGGRTELHSHEPAETFFICRGRGRMTCDGETGDVAAGDVVYLEPGSLHTLENTSSSEELVFVNVYWWPFDEHAPPAPAMVPTRSSPTRRTWSCTTLGSASSLTCTASSPHPQSRSPTSRRKR